MSHVITTQDANGRATFSSKVPEQRKQLPMPLGSMSFLYASHLFPPDISTEADIDTYVTCRDMGLGPGVACPPGGTAVSSIEIAPEMTSPMRKMPTLGIFYVLEGEVRLHLDGGDARLLKAGDSGVIRGSVHSWANETPDNGIVKLLSFSQSLALSAVS